ncbi:hypothetical protein RRF57_002642 [Xylaria bambusicola]|uniref:Uncharacterized protein n=1 Tax=Xylaria bambusicola TaxID=326684 RepID=A0AAN7Z1Z9_9PEZI
MEIGPVLDVEGIEVPLIPLPVGSVEFVIGKGVTSVGVTEPAVLPFIDDVIGNGSEAGIVKEPGTLEEMLVAPPGGSDEFVSGKGVIVLVMLAVGIEELVKEDTVISLALGLCENVRLLVSPAELPV